MNGEIVHCDVPTGQLVGEVLSVTGGEGVLDTFQRVGRFVAANAGPAIPQAAAAGAVGTALAPAA
ncbi:hypothetical protein [Azospirillum sp. SYSU D00513]|uniref:hypothetical protein n=1 Tax=Azospirillum sp. SYSU D00513 TaxID=2812561 RepID=UPI001A97504A|nr:hypothetical protein [Azospirillum sp. SYSU D00513]